MYAFRLGRETIVGIGFVGLGKLGLPCALAISVKLNEKVFGYDKNKEIANYISNKKVPYIEARVPDFFPDAKIEFCENLDSVVRNSEIIFIAVQTPHEKLFEGVTPVPNEKRDFDYSYLISSINEISESIKRIKKKDILIVVISTVLPGTMKKHVLPVIDDLSEFNIEFCYNPFFIAMGTTIPDFLNPEFLLIGSNNKSSADKLANFYQKFIAAPAEKMKIESAELTKVAYNTFIGFKIVFANTIAEICSVRGGNADEITTALTKASTRLMSPKYLSAGMADGGGCHPRDQIAMSWLAQDANLSTDIFEYLAKARDSQTKRQAQIVVKHATSSKLPIVILGKSYKANINLTIGSPALLLSYFLDEIGIGYIHFDPTIDNQEPPLASPACFFIATNHDVFKEYDFPKNSVVIDPWGNVVKESNQIKVIKPGREIED